MKWLMLSAGLMIITAFGFFPETPIPEGPMEEYCSLDYSKVDLKFKINKVGTDYLELSLNQGQGSQNLFVQFGYSSGWGKGKWGITMKGIGEQSKAPGKPDNTEKVGRFLKDNQGKPVNFYTLRHEIVEDGKGQTFMKMTWAGPSMPLLDELVVERAFDIPKSLCNRFGVKGKIQFQAGTCPMNKSINGFMIPIKIS